MIALELLAIGWMAYCIVLFFRWAHFHEDYASRLLPRVRKRFDRLLLESVLAFAVGAYLVTSLFLRD
ncbi:MAG TPA: hypothetical protein VIL71_23660 [Spirillospora sp.]